MVNAYAARTGDLLRQDLHDDGGDNAGAFAIAAATALDERLRAGAAKRQPLEKLASSFPIFGPFSHRGGRR